MFSFSFDSLVRFFQKLIFLQKVLVSLFSKLRQILIDEVYNWLRCAGKREKSKDNCNKKLNFKICSSLENVFSNRN
jgi:hypothetical protein